MSPKGFAGCAAVGVVKKKCCCLRGCANVFIDDILARPLVITTVYVELTKGLQIRFGYDGSAERTAQRKISFPLPRRGTTTAEALPHRSAQEQDFDSR